MERDGANQTRRSLLLLAGSFPFGLQANPSSFALAAANANESAGINIRSLGAKGDGRADDTEPLQAALNAGLATGKGVILPQGVYNTRGNSVRIDRGNLGSTFRFTGAGRRASRLVKIGESNEPVLSFDAADLPTEANLLLQDMSLDGAGSGVDGVRFNGIAHSTLSRLVVENCGRALHGAGALAFLAEGCSFQRSGTGVYLRRNGLAHANAITIRDCYINLNRDYGIDFGEGSMLRLRDCQLEANGTTDKVSSGAIIVRSGADGETGYSIVVIEGCWLEANRGWSVFVERTPGLIFTLRDTQILSSEGGRAVAVRGALQVLLEQVMAPSSGDTIEIDAARLTMAGGVVYQLKGNRQTDDAIRNVVFGVL